MFHRALSLLKNDNSALTISMYKNFKASWLWRKLKRLQVSEQGIRVKNLETGSYWTVNVYCLDPQQSPLDPDVSQPPIPLPRPMAARAGMRAAFAIALGLVTAALSAPFGGGLIVVAGHIAACTALALGRTAGRPLGIAAGCAALTALLLVEPVVPMAFLFGAGLGSLAWKLSFWEQMEFLDDTRPLSRLRHQIDEAMNVFIRNDPQRWDRMYAHGQWEFLHDPKLAPLYCAAADFLRLSAPTGARVVDLGCGNGALLPVLRGWHRGYLGIDLSCEAVACCPSRLGFRRDEEFRVGRVEDFSEFANFEAAVFNEMLYYLSVDRAIAAVKKAVDGLRAPATVVVVMTDNPKARRIWAALDAWRAPEERRAFRVIPSEPVCELRLYTPTASRGVPARPTDRS